MARPKGPDLEPITLRLRSETLDAVRLLANRDIRSINAEMEFLLQDALKRRGLLKNSQSSNGLDDDPSSRGDRREDLASEG